MPAHPTVDLSTTSLIKLALHAAKYPASPVCGVLLGRVTGGDGEEGESAGAGAAPAAAAVRVVDAVPLLHSGLGLAPMLEVGMCQVRSRGAGEVMEGRDRARRAGPPQINAATLFIFWFLPQPVSLHPPTLSQADAYARSRDLRLVGYYQANERPDDGDLARYGGRAAADAVARAGSAAGGEGGGGEAQEAGGGHQWEGAG